LAVKKDSAENKNRRDYATEKWEAEVRASLAQKRAATGAKLSKADQAAVDAQRAKEAIIRGQIAAVQARMKRGLEIIAALVASNAERVKAEVGMLAKVLLATGFGVGSFLLDVRVFEVFLVSMYMLSLRREAANDAESHHTRRRSLGRVSTIACFCNLAVSESAPTTGGLPGGAS
jgi:urease gamma subunit